MNARKRESFGKFQKAFLIRLTLIPLLHENQVNGFESMEVLDAHVQLGHAGYVVQREKGFTRKVISRDDVMIHYGKRYHRTFLQALLQSNRSELEALVEHWIERFLIANEEKREVRHHK